MEHALIADVAARFIGRHGTRSLEAIAAYREKADAIGDQASLQTWLDIGAAVEDLLVRRQRFGGRMCNRSQR